jgi:hypothetical protein
LPNDSDVFIGSVRQGSNAYGKLRSVWRQIPCNCVTMSTVMTL